MAGPPSMAHPPSPEASPSSWAWMTTVARSGSAGVGPPGLDVVRVLLLPPASPGGSRPGAPGPGPPPPPGAAGSSADSPNREFSSKYHQDRVGACSASPASSRDRSTRSPFRRMHPQDTPPGPGDQPGLGLWGGEPGELDHLVDAQLPRGERLGQQGEVLQGVGRGDPPAGLPVGDPVAHPQPVGHVPGPRVSPGLTPVNVCDEREQLSLGQADTAVRRIDALDQS